MNPGKTPEGHMGVTASFMGGYNGRSFEIDFYCDFSQDPGFYFSVYFPHPSIKEFLYLKVKNLRNIITLLLVPNMHVQRIIIQRVEVSKLYFHF